MGGKGSGVRNTKLRAEVERLLMQTEPFLSMAKIGELVGVSRQRVHMLAKEFAVVGRSGK